jgi:hypothetical protein
MAIEGELPMSAMGMLLCTMIALLAFGVGLVYLALTVGLPGDKPRAEPVDQGGAGRGGMARMRAGAARCGPPHMDPLGCGLPASARVGPPTH